MKDAPERPSVDTIDDIAIIKTYGYIDEYYGKEVAKLFEDQYTRGLRKFVFNLEGTRLISTLGVSIFIDIIKMLMNNQGKLAFCNCNTIIDTTFMIMGLKKYSSIYKDCQDAIKELKE